MVIPNPRHLAFVTGLLVDACPEGVATVQDAIVAATGEEPGTPDEGLTGEHSWSHLNPPVCCCACFLS